MLVSVLKHIKLHKITVTNIQCHTGHRVHWPHVLLPQHREWYLWILNSVFK